MAYKLTEQDIRNHYAFHWDYLSECTDEQMYWLGWMASDGCIYIDKNNNNKNIIALRLQNQDINLLKRFKKFIGAKSIIPYNDNSMLVKLQSKEIFQRLTKLGITERKSHTLVVHEYLADDALFWRGVFEGDGCLHWNKKIWEFYICSASYQFLQQWCKFIKISEDYIYPDGKNFKARTFQKHEVKRILHTLYIQPGIELRLERKWRLVDECLCYLDTEYLIGQLNQLNLLK